jgi:hypothetical protein
MRVEKIASAFAQIGAIEGALHVEVPAVSVVPDRALEAAIPEPSQDRGQMPQGVLARQDLRGKADLESLWRVAREHRNRRARGLAGIGEGVVEDERAVRELLEEGRGRELEAVEGHEARVHRVRGQEDDVGSLDRSLAQAQVDLGPAHVARDDLEDQGHRAPGEQCDGHPSVHPAGI